MWYRVSVSLVGVVLLGLLWGKAAEAQRQNIETVEGARGEEMTLTAKPHEVSEDLSIRAMGIADSGAHQWALSLIGVAPDDSISLSYGKESLPIQRVERPEDGIGPTKVYISEETFLTMAETETVTLQVGETRVTLPSALREEMKKIFETVT